MGIELGVECLLFPGGGGLSWFLLYKAGGRGNKQWDIPPKEERPKQKGKGKSVKNSRRPLPA